MGIIKIIKETADYVWPRYCTLCGQRLTLSERHLCLACLINMPRTDNHKLLHSNLERQFWDQFPVERAASWVYYNEVTKKLILNVKFFGNTNLGKHLGLLMANEIKDSGFFDGIDVIIPLPLHLFRKLRRGYNQCDMIAEGVSKATGIPINNKSVKRNVYSKPQSSTSHADRKANVMEAFKLTHPEGIRGKHILLIDDVITTGATISSCAQAIVEAGDVKISILSVAYATQNNTPDSDSPLLFY